MKTVKDLDYLISEIEQKYTKDGRKIGEAKQSENRKLRLFRELKMYLEKVSNPQFVQNHIDEIEFKLKNIATGYEAWKTWQPTKDHVKNSLTEYHKYMEVPKLKKQLSNLKFLLD